MAADGRRRIVVPPIVVPRIADTVRDGRINPDMANRASIVTAAANTAMPARAAFTTPTADHSAIMARVVAPVAAPVATRAAVVMAPGAAAASHSSTGRGRRGNSAAPVPIIVPIIAPTVARNTAQDTVTNVTIVPAHPPHAARFGSTVNTRSPRRSPTPPAACAGWS